MYWCLIDAVGSPRQAGKQWFIVDNIDIGTFHLHGLTLIPALMIKYIHYKV